MMMSRNSALLNLMKYSLKFVLERSRLFRGMTTYTGFTNRRKKKKKKKNHKVTGHVAQNYTDRLQFRSFETHGPDSFF